MPEIRQIRVGGVTYDVVASEDEVSASRAQQYATQAQNSATAAQSSQQVAAFYAMTANNAVNNANDAAQDANDAADRAEAIVGGQFVSYGQDQGLSDAYKSQARKNIGVTINNPNLLDNAWFGLETINENGFSSAPVTPNMPLFSRWKADTDRSGESVIELRGSWLEIVSTLTDTGYVNISQALDRAVLNRMNMNYSSYGGYLTMSVREGGSIFSGTIRRTPNTEQTFYEASSGRIILKITADNRVVVENTYNSTLRIEAVKLELGQESTLKWDMVESHGINLTRAISSAADPNDPYANSGYARSNRNLLDNPFFTVNQRGYTTGSANNDFVADRWFLYGASDLTVTNSGNGLVLTGTAGNRARLRHHMDEKMFMALYGQSMTFSIKINGQVYAFPFTVVSSYPSEQTAMLNGTITTSVGRIDAVVTWQIATNKILVYFSVYQAMTIQAVKLELGSYSTLANDVPPDYAEELDKCLYYFERVATSAHLTLGWGYAEGNATTYFSTKIHPKRTQPTIPAYSLAVSGTTSMSISTTGLSIYSWSATGHTTIRFNAATGSFTNGSLYRCGILNGGFIDFSADL